MWIFYLIITPQVDSSPQDLDKTEEALHDMSNQNPFTIKNLADKAIIAFSPTIVICPINYPSFFDKQGNQPEKLLQKNDINDD